MPVAASKDRMAAGCCPTAAAAPGAGGAEGLLARMRSGDRLAAADFFETYGPRVRRRVRGKLSPSMRRLFDSQEIVSTVARRLDAFVGEGKLEASNEGELWSLIFTIAENAVVDKARVFRRLRRVEAEDSAWARRAEECLGTAELASPGASVEQLAIAFESLGDPVDREILSLWLLDTPHVVTGRMMNMPPTAVRQRWTRIKDSLRVTLALGDDA